jgi:hypothetical protein
MCVLFNPQNPRFLTNECKVFLNIVLDDAVEEKAGSEKVPLGMVVCVGILDRRVIGPEC